MSAGHAHPHSFTVEAEGLAGIDASRVEQGDRRVDDRVEVGERDLHRGCGGMRLRVHVADHGHERLGRAGIEGRDHHPPLLRVDVHLGRALRPCRVGEGVGHPEYDAEVGLRVPPEVRDLEGAAGAARMQQHLLAAADQRQQGARHPGEREARHDDLDELGVGDREPRDRRPGARSAPRPRSVRSG